MKYVVVALLALACLALAEQNNEELLITNVQLTMPVGEPVEYSRVEEENNKPTVLVATDYIFSKQQDHKLMADISKFLKEKGYFYQMGTIGNHSWKREIHQLKKHEILLYVFGQVTGEDIYDLAINTTYKKILKEKNATMYTAFLTPPSQNIHDLKWVTCHKCPSPYDKGISLPEKKLLDAGYHVLVGKDAKELTHNIPKAKNTTVEEIPENIDIATIIMIGKAVWEIIKEGKPVVNYKTDWAGAIPKGVKWNDLEGFKDYRWGPFGWDFSNILGMNNVKFSWNFVWSCKGSYNHHGSFIMHAGASIIEIYAAWGYTVNVKVSVDKTPINYGTKVNPIAGISVEVTLDLKSVLQSFTERCRVSLRGNCAGAKVSC